MIIVTGTFEVAEGSADLTREYLTLSAQITASERGCIEYRFWQSVSRPTEFRVYEEWDDEGCLAEHTQHPNFKEHRARMAKVGVTNRQLKVIHPGEIRDLPA